MLCTVILILTLPESQTKGANKQTKLLHTICEEFCANGSCLGTFLPSFSTWRIRKWSTGASMWHQVCVCAFIHLHVLRLQPCCCCCLGRIKFPEFLCCSVRAGGVATCSQPFKMTAPPTPLSTTPLPPPHRHHPRPTPLQVGGRDWLMRAGVDSDININHAPPSGHWLTPGPPQEETSFIISPLSIHVFSHPNLPPLTLANDAFIRVPPLLLFFFLPSEENFKVDVKNSQFLCLQSFSLSLFSQSPPSSHSHSLMCVSCHLVLALIHPTPQRPPHTHTPPPHLALSPASTLCTSTSPCGAGVGQRRQDGGGCSGGGGLAEAAVWAWSGGGRGRLSASEPLTRVWFMARGGSHRDGIRGALSNRSPERGKRYLICLPRRQPPLGSVRARAHVCLTHFRISLRTVAVCPAP